MKKNNHRKGLKADQRQEGRVAKTRKAQGALIQSQVDAARVLQKQIERVGGKTVTRSKEKKGPSSTKGVVRRVGLHPASDLARWGRILSQPFLHEGEFCPVSYNPAPSFIQTTARTTSTDMSGSVAMTSTTQFAFYPGHGSSQGISTAETEMDAVSYHAKDQNVNTGGSLQRCVVGPMSKTDGAATRVPIIGVKIPGITTGLTYWDTSANTAVPVAWDVALPYVSVSGTTSTGGHHSRWQLVAMGIRFTQTTPEFARGGTFLTVQPNTVYLGTNGDAQSTLEKFPTFKDHGPEGFEISWIPRAQDLAFWHGTSDTGANGATAALIGPAVLVFINNPTGEAISYTYQVVCHWQLAGSYLNTVGRPAAHAPETKPAIEKAVSVLQNGHSSAASALGLLDAASKHSGITSGESWFETAAKLGRMAGRVTAAAA